MGKPGSAVREADWHGVYKPCPEGVGALGRSNMFGTPQLEPRQVPHLDGDQSSVHAQYGVKLQRLAASR